MAGNDDLQRWWDGLTEEEQAEAVQSMDEGQLSVETQQSLAGAGLIEPGTGAGGSIPDDIRQRLSELGRGRPGDSPDGGKMRH